MEGVGLSHQERQADVRPAPSQDILVDLPLFKVVKRSQGWEVRGDFGQSDFGQGDGKRFDSVAQRWAGSDSVPCDNEFMGGLSSDIGEPVAELSLGVDDWVEECPPTTWERDDFNEWYALAVQFKLVTDYQWCRSEYWVLVNGAWKGFCEMVAMFSGAWLRRKLQASQRIVPGISITLSE